MLALFILSGDIAKNACVYTYELDTITIKDNNVITGLGLGAKPALWTLLRDIVPSIIGQKLFFCCIYAFFFQKLMI